MQNNKYLPIYIYCFVFLIFTLLTHLILKNIVLMHEDLEFYNDLGRIIFYPDNGSYPAGIIKIITTWYMPTLLHIHPNDFVISFGSYFRAFNMVLLSYILSLLPFINSDNESLNIKKLCFHLLLFIIAYLAVWGGLFRYEAYDLKCSTAFCRLFIPNIFFAFFWLKWTKYFINPEQLTSKVLSIILLSALILGAYFELTTVISLVSMFFILIYGIVKKQKLLHIYTLPLIFLIIGSLALFINYGFINHYESKNPSLTIYTVIDNFKLYQDFFNTYWLEIIKPHLICYFIIVFSAIFSFVDKKNTNSHKITFISLCLTASFIILFLTFIIMGKNHPTGTFWWISHWGIKMTMRICLLIPTMLAINPIIQKITKNKDNKLFIIICIMSIFMIITTIVNYKNSINQFIDATLSNREKVYKYDKLVVSQLNGNLPIKLPKKYFDWDDNLELEYLSAVYGTNPSNIVFVASNFENITQELNISISDKELKDLKFKNLRK